MLDAGEEGTLQTWRQTLNDADRIAQLEGENRRLIEENGKLRALVREIETLAALDAVEVELSKPVPPPTGSHPRV